MYIIQLFYTMVAINSYYYYYYYYYIIINLYHYLIYSDFQFRI